MWVIVPIGLVALGAVLYRWQVKHNLAWQNTNDSFRAETIERQALEAATAGNFKVAADLYEQSAEIWRALISVRQRYGDSVGSRTAVVRWDACMRLAKAAREKVK